jgi:hypothetical protein
MKLRGKFQDKRIRGWKVIMKKVFLQYSTVLYSAKD